MDTGASLFTLGYAEGVNEGGRSMLGMAVTEEDLANGYMDSYIVSRVGYELLASVVPGLGQASKVNTIRKLSQAAVWAQTLRDGAAAADAGYKLATTDYSGTGKDWRGDAFQLGMGLVGARGNLGQLAKAGGAGRAGRG